MSRIETIDIYSDQFPGEPITVRVIDQHINLYAIEAVGHSMRLQSLVSNRSVTIVPVAQNDTTSYSATFKRMSGGMATLQFNSQDALTRRHFERLQLCSNMRFACVPTNRIDESRLSSLRWLKTETRDVSAGGLLFSNDTELINNNHLLINIATDEISFPSLMVGEVLHCCSHKNEYLIGVRFVVGEEFKRKRNIARLSRTIEVLKKYGKNEQVLLNTDIVARKHNNHRNGVMV